MRRWFNMYSWVAISKLMDKYVAKGGDIVTIQEGVLGYGTALLFGEGLKTCVVTEVPLNAWSSGHKIRFYNRMPKKYERILEKMGV
jgi:hypothetical protein